MKAAEVLVDDGARVLTLESYDRGSGRRGSEIYDSHQNLWAVSVFVHPSVSAEQRAVIRAYLRDRLGVSWVGHATEPTLVGLATARVAREMKLTAQQGQELELLEDVAAYRPSGDTFAELLARMSASARHLFGEQQGLGL